MEITVEKLKVNLGSNTINQHISIILPNFILYRILINYQRVMYKNAYEVS